MLLEFLKGRLLLESINVDSCISAENQHVCMSVLRLDTSNEGEIKLQSDHKLTIQHRDDIQSSLSWSCKNTSTTLAITTLFSENEK
jgi:hypothetical protein